MHSSSNRYLFKLDHLRAFAAYQVFCWHFLILIAPYPHVPPPFALLTQGHTGVAFFMCISGYIFIYLTDGMAIDIPRFWANRLLRLLPLMAFWALFGQAVSELRNPFSYLSVQWLAHYFPSYGYFDIFWSIYIELRFYLLFPILLFLMRRFGINVLIFALFIPPAYRAITCLPGSCNMQTLSYWTLWGRADQFLWGMFAFYIEKYLKSHNETKLFRAMGITALIALVIFYSWFNAHGGYSAYQGSIAPNTVWLWLPTIEAIYYSTIIICYLQLAISGKLSQFLSLVGKYSYSIYLLHKFFINMIWRFIIPHWGMPVNFYASLAIGTFIVFPMIIAISAVTYTCIEKPFLRLRLEYVKAGFNARAMQYP